VAMKLSPKSSATFVAVGLWVALLTWAYGPGPDEPRIVQVPEGATLRGIGDLLREKGVIRSSTAFVFLGRVMGAERRLRAGQFTVIPKSTPGRIVRLLVEGPIDPNEITIPEGLTLWEAAGILEREAKVDSAAFVAQATDDSVAASFGVSRPTLEGYLFPDTYDFPLGTPVEEVLSTLVSRAQRVLGEVMAGRAPPESLEVEEMVILASIVEAEARVPEERPRIAAVYLNRLRRGMRLEADPTVAYALRERRRLYYKDLEVESPWNTYRAAGLPPTAICSPGRQSLAATLAADRAEKALYFVARGDGSHIFSCTLEEHDRATRDVRLLEEQEAEAAVAGAGSRRGGEPQGASLR